MHIKIALFKKGKTVVKEFLIYTIFIIILFTAVNLHYFFSKNSINRDSLTVAKVTKITEPSLSVSSFENRFLYLDKSFDNNVYPDMMSINKAGFVYEK